MSMRKIPNLLKYLEESVESMFFQDGEIIKDNSKSLNEIKSIRDEAYAKYLRAMVDLAEGLITAGLMNKKGRD
jgi:hypothetical protein